jgi:hypothetical protein
MRSLRLLEIAAQAEALRLRRGASGMARGVAFQAVALLFGLVSLGLLHAAGWIWIAGRHEPLTAALVLAGIDLLLAGLALLLARPRHDAVAAEALRVRQESLAEVARASPVRGLVAMLVGNQLAQASATRGLAGEIGAGLVEGVVRGLSRR